MYLCSLLLLSFEHVLISDTIPIHKYFCTHHCQHPGHITVYWRSGPLKSPHLRFIMNTDNKYLFTKMLLPKVGQRQQFMQRLYHCMLTGCRATAGALCGTEAVDIENAQFR